jgi:hypothetical protein
MHWRAYVGHAPLNGSNAVADKGSKVAAASVEGVRVETAEVDGPIGAAVVVEIGRDVHGGLVLKGCLPARTPYSFQTTR